MNNQNNITNQSGYRGRLRVNVYTLDRAKPIDNALVRITTGVNQTVVEEVRTNTSGYTPVIELPTPPLDYSLNPGEPKPYSEYNIVVASEGFSPVGFEGVQILPDETALQNVNLVPVVNEVIPRNYYIYPHTLWGEFPPKIPEPEVKPLPFPEGLVVLPRPVIPEFIIVHLGAPSDTSAANVQVPFTDYIKNVASCEIYSTWPDATIRANVHAILSFTLNRVYTEWYRGKGYNFTITNSTAFDQAFVNGRNIFENISVIVDEIFTTYITRPSANQPLLTQYCDGERTQCPNAMSQWGSKFLGDQGYSSLNILKNYYGQDIFLAQAEKVEGIPESYPGTPLQSGSTGQFVRTIQEQLNAISNNYPAINKLRVDGIFGPQTENAVKTFQTVFNLPVTGIVDEATWYAISNIFVAITKPGMV